MVDQKTKSATDAMSRRLAPECRMCGCSALTKISLQYVRSGWEVLCLDAWQCWLRAVDEREYLEARALVERGSLRG